MPLYVEESGAADASSGSENAPSILLLVSRHPDLVTRAVFSGVTAAPLPDALQRLI